MENDLALPPNRPRPKGGNYPKKAKAENRPRATAAPAKVKEEGISTGFIVGAVGVGLLLAYLSTLEAKGGDAPKRHTLGPMDGSRWVRIKSLNGEPLYAKTRSTGDFPDGWGDPATTIGRVDDGAIIGMYTGQYYEPSSYYPRLIQVYGQTPDGIEFNAWVQENQTEYVYPQQWSAGQPYPRNVAVVTDSKVVAAIRNYYPQ